ncbi:MAG: cupin domain-containing protein [Vicinamibacterales bacterium]
MGRPIGVVNLADKFSKITTHWDPKIAGALNGQHVKLARFKGPFVWHQHEGEDELFLVVKGRLTMHFRDRSVEVGEGEFIIVPRGVEHLPEAPDEAHVVLFEPASTVNTGNAKDARTVEHPGWI